MDDKITRDELWGMFGDELPMEAVNLIWNAPAEKTVREVREELREMGKRIQADAQNPIKIARKIVSEEWARAVQEFHLTPGSVTEAVVARIVNRLDGTAVTNGEL